MSPVFQLELGTAATVPPPASALQMAHRHDWIDFCKGFLVVTMVVYHTLNYFSQQIQAPYSYIKFVSGGFIFITGYIVGALYSVKWPRDPRGVTVRLLSRGGKLLALFTLINIVLAAISFDNYGGRDFSLTRLAENVLAIYTVGYPRIVAFDILVPIGYLLLLSPALLSMQRYLGLTVVFSTILFVIALVCRRVLNNYTMILIGFVGVVSGTWVKPARVTAPWHLLVSGPAVVAMLISLPHWDDSLFCYIVYVALVLKCVCDACTLLPPRATPRRFLCLLGEYVLFCYLAQIFVLQAVSRVFMTDRRASVPWCTLIMLLTCTTLLAAVFALQASRKRVKWVDVGYRAVFA